MSAKLLDTRTRRELTSREAASLLGGFLGGLSGSCPPATIQAALQFYTSPQVANQSAVLWGANWANTLEGGQVIPDPDR